MKKIIATLLSSILVVTLFVGCGDKKDKIILDKDKDIINGDIYDSVTSIYKDSKLKLIIDPIDENEKTLEIELYFKKENNNLKALSDKYNNTCKEIVSRTQDVLKNYRDLTDIEFVPKVDGENIIAYIRYKRNSNGFELSGDMSSPSDFEESKNSDEEKDSSSISEMSIKPVLNGIKDKEIGKYGEAEYDPYDIKDEDLVKFYNQNVKDSGLNWVTLVDKYDDTKGIVFTGSNNILDYGTISKDGSLIKSDKTRIIEDNKIKDFK